MTNSPSARTTAYDYNTRPGKGSKKVVRSGWDPAIDRLLAEDYAFLGFRYASPGYLFRGLYNGLENSIAGGRFGFYQDSRPLCNLEHELGVHLVSHELSDAVSVSRLWEGGHDGPLLVIDAQRFDIAWQARRAAVLGFAEPGVVFKYPFMVEALALEEVAYIVVHPDTYGYLAGASKGCGLGERIITPTLTDSNSSDRTAMETALQDLLSAQDVVPARPLPTDTRPRRGG